jgi:hypothetical protein
MIINGFVIKEDEDIDEIADGYIVIDKDEWFIKQNGKLETFDKLVFEFAKTTKKKSYIDA